MDHLFEKDPQGDPHQHLDGPPETTRDNCGDHLDDP
jgi:hypothetical protein